MAKNKSEAQVADLGRPVGQKEEADQILEATSRFLTVFISHQPEAVKEGLVRDLVLTVAAFAFAEGARWGLHANRRLH